MQVLKPNPHCRTVTSLHSKHLMSIFAPLLYFSSGARRKGESRTLWGIKNSLPGASTLRCRLAGGSGLWLWVSVHIVIVVILFLLWLTETAEQTSETIEMQNCGNANVECSPQLIELTFGVEGCCRSTGSFDQCYLPYENGTNKDGPQKASNDQTKAQHLAAHHFSFLSVLTHCCESFCMLTIYPEVSCQTWCQAW